MQKTIPIILFFLSMFMLENHAQEKANYNVEGWATYTPGGRGGKIIRVSNLNASGAGSLAEAIASTGARIIVFEVCGVIDLGGTTIKIRNPYVTVAGQTAPGKGITLINGGMTVNTHDVILQHIRIRPGAAGHEPGTWEPDAISTVGAHHVVIDHCSFSWAVDENCSASGDRFNGETPDDWRKNTSHDVTISNNIIAEGLSNATHIKGEHSKGSLIHDNVTNIAILNNLYISNKDRNPLFKGGARGVIVNNYIHNPGTAAISFGLVDSEWTGHEYQSGQMTIVGNYLHYGPSTGSSLVMVKLGDGPCEVFLSDNISFKSSGSYYDEYSGDATKIVTGKPIWNENIHVISSADVQQNIVENAGARPWDRDQTDGRLVNEMLSGTGKIIDFETEVGGYPDYNSITASFIEEEWNLDYMMKLGPDLKISSPNSESQFNKDAVFAVEATVNNTSNSINNLDLIINGVSAGKIAQPPYRWEISLKDTGDYELLAVADMDNSMKMASHTVSISIADPSVTRINSRIIEPLDYKVFPNPFSDLLTIRFKLAQSQYVKLCIYNSCGAQVQTLVSGYESDGEHRYVWEPEQLPAGIYLCQLIAGNRILSRTIVYR